MMMKQSEHYMRLILMAVLAVVVASCASMGRPEGGPIDETPPVYIRSNPTPGAVNVSADRFTIYFDENVQIKDVMNKVVVSPPQKSMPKVTAVGHMVRVEMVDTILPNTTYTVDFTDGISDLNEGNELEGFAFDFSTGPTLDSLCISGMVFEAETLEPAQGMLVGVHSNMSDTALTKLPFDRITRTNQLGQFTIRNLKEGSYRIFAINDVNRDNKWDRSEDVAFYDAVITPTASRVEVSDTLKNSEGADSIVSVMSTMFEPNDVLLTWFNEKYKSHYLAKYERNDRRRIYLEMGAPNDSFPTIRFVDGDHDGELFTDYAVLKASPTRDTLDYWIADSMIYRADSLRLAVSYERTDSLDNIEWATDTLNFNLRAHKSKKSSKAKKGDSKSDKKDEDGEMGDSIKIEFLKLTVKNSATVDVFMPLMIESEHPVKQWNDSAFHLEQMVDTVWQELSPPVFTHPDSLNPMTLRADVVWEPGGKYRLTVDSLGVIGLYDTWNAPLKFDFSVRKLEDYGNITFNISNLPQQPAVVQLLNSQDKPVKTATVVDGKAMFRNLMPETYYARLFIDRNGNGKYDTGNVTDSIQPEETYYFSKKIALKKNWDIEQSWDIYELPVDMQKPLEIKKNKPKKKKGEVDNYNDDEDDQYYDEFGNPAVDPDDPFGKRKGHRYNTLNGRDNNTRGRGTGYR